MLSTTASEFGDVVLVPFPFTDQTGVKKRPAIVVSSSAYQRQRPDLILMAVTSQTRPASATDEATISQWRHAGLLKPSVAKPVLATVHRSLVLRKLGRLRAKDLTAVEAALDRILRA
jgi:mRNA-degrading endonuclease toxin of MazEF toxin-antitoxin module